MSKRSQIQEHLQKLNEIGDIMRAMKNVSLMELHKLARFHEQQQRVLAGIEAASADVIRHHAGTLQPLQADTMTHIVAMGSERGFCGDYNDAVANALGDLVQDRALPIVVVGSRLQQRLELPGRAIRYVPGASTVEEVKSVLDMVMRELARDDTRVPVAVTVVCHQDGRPAVLAQAVSALPRTASNEAREAYPPLLNLPVPALHYQLMRHYLWAQLHQLFYSALLAEHRFRLQHMESALQRMEEKTAALSRRQNILRQEEITEEIEVIMLNSDVKRVRGRTDRRSSWQ